MKQWLTTISLVVPLLLCAQKRTYIGVNITPVILNTLDVRAEHQVNRFFSIQMAAGFRAQSRDSVWRPRVRALEDFIHLRDQALFLSVGARLFDRPARFATEYPYISFELVGVYYNEEVIIRSDFQPPVKLYPKGAKLGASVQIGFVSELMNRVHVDFALQMGYSKPRSDLLSYYLPSMGYTVFGLDIIGVKGGHLQPIITIKYNLVKDKRRRIREKE
ncbi:MAG: hypothetical protein D6730_15450 [Bacteroidetes bacterium]|nr:MAG: hypothetical protein D6730_15450 [Bacteroidota bacterium]